jgi:hypothetical protein
MSSAPRPDASTRLFSSPVKSVASRHAIGESHHGLVGISIFNWRRTMANHSSAARLRMLQWRGHSAQCRIRHSRQTYSPAECRNGVQSHAGTVTVFNAAVPGWTSTPRRSRRDGPLRSGSSSEFAFADWMRGFTVAGVRPRKRSFGSLSLSAFSFRYINETKYALWALLSEVNNEAPGAIHFSDHIRGMAVRSFRCEASRRRTSGASQRRR